MEKFNFKKSLGQNFLQDDNIINKPYESKAGILERILFRFKKQKNQ